MFRQCFGLRSISLTFRPIRGNKTKQLHIGRTLQTSGEHKQLARRCWLCGRDGHNATECDVPVTTDFAVNLQTHKLLHRPVMTEEVLTALGVPNVAQYETFSMFDATFGAGGHSREVLRRLPASTVVAVDQDPTAHAIACKFKEESGGRVVPIQGRFGDLPELFTLEGLQFGKFDGALFDVGVSSMQLDDGRRGFSFMESGPLDMRMNPKDQSGLQAYDLINCATETQLADIISRYGGERYHKLIAAAIVSARKKFGIISKTDQLAAIIEQAVNKRRKSRAIHPATQTFQALRIFINDEINELENGLKHGARTLKIGGSLVVLVFHSLEEHAMRRFMRKSTFRKSKDASTPQFKWNKALSPTDDEITSNPRSRSAVLFSGIRFR